MARLYVNWILEADGEISPVCPRTGSLALNREPDGLWCDRCHEHHVETREPAREAMECAARGEYKPTAAGCDNCAWPNADHVGHGFPVLPQSPDARPWNQV